DTFLQMYEFHEVPLTWFDTELKTVFGIDVFSSDFPKSTGYKIYEGLQADILLLRLESLKSCSGDAFKDFLNIDDFTLRPTNISEGKDYYPTYREFLDSVVLPPAYIDKMYESKYTKHFYTEDEIDIFKARWSKRKIPLDPKPYVMSSQTRKDTINDHESQKSASPK
ncbi:MAG: putative capsular polysaccharide synthesis family protein, partial [Nitrososphaera sp.]|nr:putative capsular polysaccharide synthesis family protein [Nitrososphaera sp.]